MTALGDVRALRALNMRRNGSRLDDVAKEFGVTRSRAGQLAARGQELERRITSTDPWDELSVRVRHALSYDGCEPTPDGVVAHFKVNDWKRVVAFGKVSFAELNAWLVRHGAEEIPHD